jgi:DNA replication protein DnaD
MESASQSRRVDTAAAVTARWGYAAHGRKHGFVVVPHTLLRHQGSLGMSDGELVVSMHFLMHWNLKTPENLPFVTAAKIADRMGTTTRTIQRHIGGLVRKGLLVRLRAEATQDGPVIRRFDPTPLVNKVRRLAGEPFEVEPSAKTVKRVEMDDLDF